MRKLIARSVLALLALVVFSSAASAAPIQIGLFSWSITLEDPNGAPTEGAFSIQNLSGGGALNDNYPETLLSFSLLNIAALGPAVDYPQAGMTDNGGGNYDQFLLPASFHSSASLTGNVNQAFITVDGNLYAILNPAIFTLNNDVLGNVIGTGADGEIDASGFFDAEVIYVNAERVNDVVPEPATMLLLGSGVAGLVARRRRAAKKA